MKEIYLAGGCFWGTEHLFKQIDGVIDTATGFANGNPNAPIKPTYEEVYTDQTGYAETVRIRYDETRVGLRFLLKIFFLSIDPTSLNQQGHDIGTRYRTGIYYTSPDDLPTITDIMATQQSHYDKPLAVEVEPLHHFYPADEYHQDYLDKNPNGYCHLPLELFRMVKEMKPEV